MSAPHDPSQLQPSYGSSAPPAPFPPPAGGQPVQYRPTATQVAPAAYPPPGGHYATMQVGSRPIGQRRGAWAVWWLALLTFGIYYLVWYAKINGELRRFAPDAVKVNPTLAWLAQLLPIFNLVSLYNTGKRPNAAAGAIGSPVRVSPGMCVLSAFWFSSQTRYIQRRLNGLWDATQTATQHAR